MKTITVKVKKEFFEEHEMEVDLPLYVKYGSNFYSIENENEYLEVIKDGKLHGIRQCHCKGVVDLLLIQGERITEEQFNEKLSLAFSHISLSVMKQTTGPATQEEIDEKIYSDWSEPYQESVYDE